MSSVHTTINGQWFKFTLGMEWAEAHGCGGRVGTHPPYGCTGAGVNLGKENDRRSVRGQIRITKPGKDSIQEANMHGRAEKVQVVFGELESMVVNFVQVGLAVRADSYNIWFLFRGFCKYAADGLRIFIIAKNHLCMVRKREENTTISIGQGQGHQIYCQVEMEAKNSEIGDIHHWLRDMMIEETGIPRLWYTLTTIFLRKTTPTGREEKEKAKLVAFMRQNNARNVFSQIQTARRDAKLIKIRNNDNGSGDREESRAWMQGDNWKWCHWQREDQTHWREATKDLGWEMSEKDDS
ncbi:hypothetical protein OG21DRAFT_1527680 [Imleria badia]|nr:hypothetical protein OG21DRAFT_1527680 [Imleria badia]